MAFKHPQEFRVGVEPVWHLTRTMEAKGLTTEGATAGPGDTGVGCGGGGHTAQNDHQADFWHQTPHRVRTGKPLVA